MTENDQNYANFMLFQLIQKYFSQQNCADTVNELHIRNANAQQIFGHLPTCQFLLLIFSWDTGNLLLSFTAFTT